MKVRWMVLGVAIGIGAGCNNENKTTDTTDTTDTTPTDTGAETTAETAAETTPETSEETAQETIAETDQEVTPGPFGFVIRLPQADRTPTCNVADPGGGGTFKANDADYVCTYAYAAATHTLYFQSTPTGCVNGGFEPLPSFTTTAWVSKNGVVTQLASASYDIGGNHHNDSLKFTLDGVTYTYGHSSFGWGFRACQPPDCLQRMSDADPNVVSDDGCTTARTHPIVCQVVQADGTFAALDDTFEKCPGDPNVTPGTP